MLYEKLFKLTIKKLKKIKDDITSEEAEYILGKIKNLDQDIFTGKTLDNASTVLANTFYEELELLHRKEKNLIDIHAYLQNELGTESEHALTKHSIKQTDTINTLLHKPRILQSIFNPRSLVKTAYILLDSRYRVRDSISNNLFKWNLNYSGSNYDPNTTAVSTARIINIGSVKMLPFKFPYTTGALTNHNRLAVEIVELNNQAYISYNNRFHFEFDIESGGVGYSQYICKDLGSNVAVFTFTNPVAELNTISLRFYNPYSLLTLDPDILYGTITSNSAQSVITFTKPPMVALGDMVVIQQFTTTNPTADFVSIEQMNDPDGWPITAVTTFSITIDVDISGLTGGIVTNPLPVYLQSKRFSIRLEMSYLDR